MLVGLAMVALAERAIACKGWRWMPGMKVAGDGRLWRDWTGGLAMTGLIEGTEWLANVGELPDLSDPCTLGGLLSLVREAYGNPRAVICWQGGAQCGYWETFVADSEITADTEAEALVAALECAP